MKKNILYLLLLSMVVLVSCNQGLYLSEEDARKEEIKSYLEEQIAIIKNDKEGSILNNSAKIDEMINKAMIYANEIHSMSKVDSNVDSNIDIGDSAAYIPSLEYTFDDIQPERLQKYVKGLPASVKEVLKNHIGEIIALNLSKYINHGSDYYILGELAEKYKKEFRAHLLLAYNQFMLNFFFLNPHQIAALFNTAKKYQKKYNSIVNSALYKHDYTPGEKVYDGRLDRFLTEGKISVTVNSDTLFDLPHISFTMYENYTTDEDPIIIYSKVLKERGHVTKIESFDIDFPIRTATYMLYLLEANITYSYELAAIDPFAHRDMFAHTSDITRKLIISSVHDLLCEPVISIKSSLTHSSVSLSSKCAHVPF